MKSNTIKQAYGKGIISRMTGFGHKNPYSLFHFPQNVAWYFGWKRFDKWSKKEKPKNNKTDLKV